ncbi:MAG: hypothetical protein E3J86_12380 [Candidatus Thorarchaeota archaeon]|nr:MAG: hypothetical protein E3J86_12380 [Candidatus Thorarchaeota archaeon]
MKSEPSLSAFERVSEHHGDLTEKLYTRTLVKAGLADWALHSLEWFKDGHLESSKRLIDLLQDESLIPSADSLQPIIGSPDISKLVDDRIERIIIEKIYLVVCPHCGGKTQQGERSCRTCNALL